MKISNVKQGIIIIIDLSRYEIRRDDPTPAPWSKEGKKRMEDMGSEINYYSNHFDFTCNKLASFANVIAISNLKLEITH